MAIESETTMMQMQPHLQHHSQPPMHPGQAQPQPPPHHMQMNPMATAQQQQQIMVQQQQQQQQQQMGMPPQQQQNHLTNANMNGMMNMGMTPPQSHYMNQQMSHSQQQGQQHPQVPGHPMQQQQQPGGHMSPHQVAPPLSGSPPQQNATPQQCIRHGCQNLAIVSSDWEDEYCSNECVITHCRDVFGNWVQTNNSQQQTYSAVK